ncbi:MAG: OmpA family protein [Candidatus Thiodiazotropha sp.]
MNGKSHIGDLEAQAWYAWEEPASEPSWLLTYVDVLSVILAMLVVLLGQMAVRQFQPLEEEHRVTEPVAEVLPMEQPQIAGQPVIPASSPVETAREDAEARLVAEIEHRFDDKVKVVQREQGVSLEIAESILFRTNEAVLLPQALPILAKLAATLQSIGDANIAVEGHTDNRPIRGGRYESNWELAAARANAVTRFLLEQGFSPQHLRSVSYADARPVADNTSAAGRAENRRVNLKVEFL